MKEVNEFLKIVNEKLDINSQHSIDCSLFYSNDYPLLANSDYRQKILSILSLNKQISQCYVYQPTRTASNYCLYVHSCKEQEYVDRPQYPQPNPEPFIKWMHADGPLLVCSTGAIHWLSFLEIIMVFFKIKSVYDLNSLYK